jgi:hypothetical protein
MTNCITPREQWYMTSIIRWKTPQGTAANCATHCPGNSLKRPTCDTFLIMFVICMSYRRLSFEYIETTRRAFFSFSVFHSLLFRFLNLLHVLCRLPYQNADCKYYASLRIWIRGQSRDKLQCTYFGFFICSSTKEHFIYNYTDIPLLCHIYSLPKFRRLLSRGRSCSIPCCRKSVSYVISHRVTAVLASQSSSYLRSPRFCFSAGNNLYWLGDTFVWCNHSQCRFVSKLAVNLFLTHPRNLRKCVTLSVVYVWHFDSENATCRETFLTCAFFSTLESLSDC